jgi:hypothetical protein
LFYLHICKTGMITMLSNSLVQQHNVNRLACHITMKVVSEDSSCSMVGSVEASKANLGFRCHMAPGIYGIIIICPYDV